MKIQTKYGYLDYVKIIPLEGMVGRIAEVKISSTILYVVEYWVDSKLTTATLYEDEIEALLKERG